VLPEGSVIVPRSDVLTWAQAVPLSEVREAKIMVARTKHGRAIDTFHRVTDSECLAVIGHLFSCWN